MEGIVIGTEFIGSFFAILGGAVLLALVASVVFFGYMSEEESRGSRLFWAEWPIPETGVTAAEEKIHLAA